MNGRISIGIVTPHAAAGPESEWPSALPGRLGTRTARITAGDPSVAPPTSPSGLRALARPELVDAAVVTLDPSSLDAVGYASTSTGYVLGHAAEHAMLARLADTWGVGAASTSAAAVSALRQLDVGCVAVLHPPWFGASLHELGIGYFRGQGFEVTAAVLDDLPDDPARVRAGDVVSAVPPLVPDSAQALFLGGNGLRSTAAVAALEAALGRPVITSNQVLLWGLLRGLDVRHHVSGYGTLFAPTHMTIADDGTTT